MDNLDFENEQTLDELLDSEEFKKKIQELKEQLYVVEFFSTTANEWQTVDALKLHISEINKYIGAYPVGITKWDDVVYCIGFNQYAMEEV